MGDDGDGPAPVGGGRTTRALDEAVLLDLSEAYVAEMQDIFAEQQRKIRVELERACRPLSRPFPREDEDTDAGRGAALQGRSADLQLTTVPTVADRAGREEGGSSTAGDRRKLVATLPRATEERYLRKILELEAALRNAKASGKRPQIQSQTQSLSPPTPRRNLRSTAAAAVVANFPEPEEDEFLTGEQLRQLKEHVAAVQQQCDDARS